MCTRISVFVPTAASLDALESWSEDCGVGIERVAGAEGQWRDTTILVTRSYCDCGTPIGHMTRSGPRHDPERTVRELRKRGWSEAKIARSLSQKKDAKERKDAQRAANAVAALTDWVTRRETSTLRSLEPLVLARLDRGVLHEFSTAR